MQNCTFEWERTSHNPFKWGAKWLLGKARGEVQKKACSELDSRVKYIGNFANRHECKIELSNVKIEDNGIWSCHMEEYKYGNFRQEFLGWRNTDSRSVRVLVKSGMLFVLNF